MHNSCCMGLGQSIGDLGEPLKKSMEARLMMYFLAERLTINQFHRHKARAFGFAYFVDVGDMRMIESSGCFGLLLEATHASFIGRDLCMQHF